MSSQPRTANPPIAISLATSLSSKPMYVYYYPRWWKAASYLLVFDAAHELAGIEHGGA